MEAKFRFPHTTFHRKKNGVSVGWGTLSIQDGNTTINVSPSGVSVSKSK